MVELEDEVRQTELVHDLFLGLADRHHIAVGAILLTELVVEGEVEVGDMHMWKVFFFDLVRNRDHM